MKIRRECGGVGYPGVQRGKAFLCSLFGMFKGGMVQQMELHLEFLAFVCYVPRHPEMTTEFSKTKRHASPRASQPPTMEESTASGEGLAGTGSLEELRQREC